MDTLGLGVLFKDTENELQTLGMEPATISTRSQSLKPLPYPGPAIQKSKYNRVPHVLRRVGLSPGTSVELDAHPPHPGVTAGWRHDRPSRLVAADGDTGADGQAFDCQVEGATAPSVQNKGGGGKSKRDVSFLTGY